ncbi:MAG: RES domain-containing protein [Acidobacteria bacterium]|nr:RES domain-containing protein [Acidobacteriota bacterium]
MKVWRIARSGHAGTVESMLSGSGAARYGGRWNPKGMPAVYCSENSSLAALEVLVNLARPSTFPSYRILDLDVPDGSIALAPGPTADARQTGAALLRAHLAFLAPSAVNPLERNVVINPAHPDFDKVVPGTIRPFVFDRRLALG